MRSRRASALVNDAGAMLPCTCAVRLGERIARISAEATSSGANLSPGLDFTTRGLPPTSATVASRGASIGAPPLRRASTRWASALARIVGTSRSPWCREPSRRAYAEGGSRSGVWPKRSSTGDDNAGLAKRWTKSWMAAASMTGGVGVSSRRTDGSSVR